MPLGSSAAPQGRAAQLQKKEEILRSKIGRRKGTERVLSTEISAYSRRINRRQGKIETLGEREARLQADLDAKRAELFQTQRDLFRSRYDVLVGSLRLRQASGQLAPLDLLAVDALLKP